MEGVKRKLQFNNMVAVNCEGEGRRRSGGLALLWQDPILIQLRSFSINHIDVQVPKGSR